MGECQSSKTLIDALFGFATSSNTIMSEYCLKSLYYLFHYQPHSIIVSMDQYVQMLKNMICRKHNSDNFGIIKVMTDTLIVMMNEHWSKLIAPNEKTESLKLFDFVLSATMSEDEQVCITAAEFWALYATNPSMNSSILISYFPKLIPVLVKRCRYTDDLLAQIDFENDCQSKADLSEDVAPVFYKDRNNKNNGDNKRNIAMDEEESAWNIRKCSASQLEKLSFIGGEVKKSLLSITLPIIQSALKSSDFLDREAGLLVLGAVTQREYESIIPSLPELIPFILEQSKADQHILVQQIANWSLARFSNWYNSNDEFFQKVLFQFLSAMQSNSKRVQRAACGAIATFITSTNAKILDKKEYIEALMNTFLKCFEHYHLKNFPHLIDVILCCTNVICHNTQNKDSKDNILCDAKFQDALLPPIIQRWIALQSDTNIFPLFEAITQWTSHIGHTEHFQTKYLKQIFVTCLNICIELKNESNEYAEYFKTVRKGKGKEDREDEDEEEEEEEEEE